MLFSSTHCASRCRLSGLGLGRTKLQGISELAAGAGRLLPQPDVNYALFVIEVKDKPDRTSRFLDREDYRRP